MYRYSRTTSMPALRLNQSFHFIRHTMEKLIVNNSWYPCSKLNEEYFDETNEKRFSILYIQLFFSFFSRPQRILKTRCARSGLVQTCSVIYCILLSKIRVYLPFADAFQQHGCNHTKWIEKFICCLCLNSDENNSVTYSHWIDAVIS